MYALEEHMQISLGSRSASHVLIALVVQMKAVLVPFVLIASSSMIYLQLVNQSFRIHQSIVQLVHQMLFVKQTQHSMILVFKRIIGDTQETPQGCIIVNAVAHVSAQPPFLMRK
jgi:hypothetical protein